MRSLLKKASTTVMDIALTHLASVTEDKRLRLPALNSLQKNGRPLYWSRETIPSRLASLESQNSYRKRRNDAIISRISALENQRATNESKIVDMITYKTPVSLSRDKFAIYESPYKVKRF